MSKLEPWKVTHSTITYQDRWLKVRSDTCETRTGQVIEPFHVLEFPTWVNVVALTRDEQIILVREYRHGASQILLGLPCGVMDADDADSAETAGRELSEETGYSTNVVLPLASHFANPANQNNLTCSFLAVDCERTGPPKPDTSEEIDVLHDDFLSFMERFWLGQVALQSSHSGAIHAASHMILAGRAPTSAGLRQALIALFLRTHQIELPVNQPAADRRSRD